MYWEGTMVAIVVSLLAFVSLTKLQDSFSTAKQMLSLASVWMKSRNEFLSIVRNQDLL